ncbi:hypothetical protein [Nocardioides pantholopis]|uniref:hypothetical protein n=1 Tax=Nocardioides pantholopis TaxID=2483798 RepID=UPI000F0747CA|nr:hypothetical protein [Nocardioides pantholopis]
MPRPQSLDLRAADLSWRTVPMPGANLGLDLVPLASTGETFAILGRFPVGFVRDEPGGYLAAEDFVVLAGHLELEGERYGAGRLTSVPARHLRTRMAAPQGCTVLAWFGGPAVFRDPAEIAPHSDEPIRSWDLAALGEDEVVSTADASWRRCRTAHWRVGVDGFDLAGTGWSRSPELWPGSGLPGDLVLREPAADG